MILNTLIYDSSQVWYLSSKLCRAALIIKHLSVFESNFVGFGSCLFKLLNLSTSQARILAGYQSYHLTYQLTISSIYLILAYQSQSCIQAMVSQHQICGGKFKLISHVTSLVLCKDSRLRSSVNQIYPSTKTGGGK